jgi:hypothetical protein
MAGLDPAIHIGTYLMTTEMEVGACGASRLPLC